MTWTPGRFEDHRVLFPRTPELGPVDNSLLGGFADAWENLGDDELAGALGASGPLQVGFVRGYLGNWMPGNLDAPVAGLRELGIDAIRLRNHTSQTVEHNIALLGPQLHDSDAPLILCGHSKGGLESLALALTDPVVRRRLRGIVLSQTPRGPAAVMESLLERQHQHTLPGWRRRSEEAVQRVGLHLIGATPGGRQLTRGPLVEVLDGLDLSQLDVPIWQTASWSSQPTTWLDSFHGRLGEIRPGCAHDGQFFIEDLIWPEIPHLLLAHLDHAQPAMGGFGFDHVRYWRLLVAMQIGAI